MTVEVIKPVNAEQAALLTNTDRLNKIDWLRDNNIGRYLPLPQLVAVGDQSSGKSSLLESLTGIPFPRDPECCTRYATQITHRRENQSQINISIIPGPNASSEEIGQLEKYSKRLETTSQLLAELPDILDEVNKRMDIRSSKNPTGGKAFSEDVLKVEKCGPHEDYLTIIDVPGIFRDTFEATEEDKILVTNMVKRYIRDSRTIILAVLGCNGDISTTDILSLAEKYDKNGDRTLGILTKADLVLERTKQEVVCAIVEGKKRPLNLGYCLVRNKGADHKDSEFFSVEERDQLFANEPWCLLPKERLGISALRKRLEELLGQITDQEFPKLRRDMRQMLGAAQDELNKLGPVRETEQEQRQYLTTVVSGFQDMVRAALVADYSALDDFSGDELRLITQVVNITQQFNSDFKNFAHAYAFETAEEGEGQGETKAEEVGDAVTTTGDDTSDLANIVTDDLKKPQPKDGIMVWIRHMYHRSRGVELGTFGHHLLSSAFREQSSNWSLITKQYFSKVIIAIHVFILRGLEIVFPDKRGREELLSRLLTELLPRYSQGMEHAMLLVNIERQKRPYTLNSSFRSSLEASRRARVTEQLESLVIQENGQVNGDSAASNLHKIETTIRDRSNAEHAAEDIHDILKAYYEVARKRFVDNIYHQAVDHCLLSGPKSPLSLFDQGWVLKVNEADLKAIAGELPEISERREALKTRIKHLEEAIKIMR